MKKYNLVWFLAAGIALSAGLSSCLKTESQYVDLSQVGAIAQIPSAAFYGVADHQSFLTTKTPTPFTFDVSVASPNLPASSTDITVGVNGAALTQYNTDNGDSLALLPDSTYSLANATVTVPAGQRLATVTLNFNTTKIDATKRYALPVSIKSATNGVAVSSNYGTKLIIIAIRNAFDGAYHSVGTFNHPTAGIRKIDRDKKLTTINANTSSTEYADLGGSGWTMNLVVNPDNTVTIVPTGASNAGTMQTGVNKYDPATKSFTLSYQYAGSGGNRIVNEVITLKQ